VQVAAGPLENPREPPLAATLREMEALVVSRETTAGADWIQGVRRDLGFAPLRVLVVGLVGGVEEGTKLSSTALREEEAAHGRGPS
jgi:pantetheine-phosphate adenylyltransferase